MKPMASNRISFDLYICLYCDCRCGQGHFETVCHKAVETNNGTEALNRLLKYQYLPRQKHMTLSHIISNITEEFLPALCYNYIYKNFKQSDLYTI